MSVTHPCFTTVCIEQCHCLSTKQISLSYQHHGLHDTPLFVNKVDIIIIPRIIVNMIVYTKCFQMLVFIQMIWYFNDIKIYKKNTKFVLNI